MGAPLQIRTINDQLYNAMLSASYRTNYIWDQSYALSKDADIFEVILRDASFASSIDRFQNSVVRPFRVEAPKGTKNTQSKKAARIVEEALRKSMLFDDMRKRLALGRVLGRSYEFANWEAMDCALADNPPMKWMIPVSFENLDRRRIRWVPKWGEDGIYNGTSDGPLTTKRYLWSITHNQWLEMSDEFKDALIEDIYPLSEDRLGTGRGCLDKFYIYAYYKAIFLEKMSQGVDRWANGMLVGKIDSARLASLQKTSAAVQTAMTQVLQTARSEHVIVLDKADEIEVISGGMEGHQMCMEGIKYTDECVERLLNGSIRGSGHGQQNGARAAAETESDSSEAFYQPYRQHQDEILTRDLIGYFWNHPINRQNFLKMGLGIAERPHFTSEQIKKKSPLEAIQIIAAARQAGIPFLKSEVYEDLEKTMPEPGEDVFDGALAMGGEGGMNLDSSGAPQGLNPKEAAVKKQDERDHELEMVKAKGEKEKAAFQANLDNLSTRYEAESKVLAAKMEVMASKFQAPAPQAPNISINAEVRSSDDTMKEFIAVMSQQVEALKQFGRELALMRDAIPTPIINVTNKIEQQEMPAQAAPIVNVMVPEQAAPVINVAAPEVTVKNEVILPKDAVKVEVIQPAREKIVRKAVAIRDERGLLLGAEMSESKAE